MGQYETPQGGPSTGAFQAAYNPAVIEQENRRRATILAAVRRIKGVEQTVPNDTPGSSTMMSFKERLKELARGDYINTLIHKTWLLGPSLKKKYVEQAASGINGGDGLAAHFKGIGKTEAALPLWNMYRSPSIMNGGQKWLNIHRHSEASQRLAPLFRRAYSKLKDEVPKGGMLVTKQSYLNQVPKMKSQGRNFSFKERLRELSDG